MSAIDVRTSDDVDILEQQLRLNGKLGASDAAAPPCLWPTPLSQDAYCGVVGDIVAALSPQTEADPAALMVHLLVGLGNLIGPGPYFAVGGAKHHLSLFAVMVGDSSRGRKGQSASDLAPIFERTDEHWFTNQVMSGMSTGEGLIWAVRDPIEKQETVRDPKTKRPTGECVSIVVDRGKDDKRLMVLEPEFCSVLKVANRDGNTLSALIRQAWDSGTLRILNKNTPTQATGAHISIVGHITRDELLRYLTATEQANGFANRFLWVAVRRSKLLPDGGDVQSAMTSTLVDRVQNAVMFARTAVREIKRGEHSAHDLWHSVYPKLTSDRRGLLGAVTARAEAQVMRLACIFSVLDHSMVVTEIHLKAALEIWRYCDESARCIFGDVLGDQTADEISRLLNSRPDGISRTKIMEYFKRHKRSSEIERALSVLQSEGHGICTAEYTTGRPREVWFPIPAK